MCRRCIIPAQWALLHFTYQSGNKPEASPSCTYFRQAVNNLYRMRVVFPPKLEANGLVSHFKGQGERDAYSFTKTLKKALSRSNHCHSTIYMQGLTGHVTGFLTRQIDDSGANIVRLPQTTRRNRA
jgi:hypothetical protein